MHDPYKKANEMRAKSSIGMKEAIAQSLAQEGLHQHHCQVVKVKTCLLQSDFVRHLDAVNPFHRQNIAAGMHPINFRHTETFILGDILPKF